MPREREQYIPKEELSEEERARVEALESSTDEIYRLRTQLVEFYREYRRYLPEEKVNGKTRRMRLPDLARALAEGKKLEDIIPFERVDKEVEELRLSPKKKDRLKKWRRLRVANAFERANRNYGELRDLGGAWTEGELSDADRENQDFYKMRWRELADAAGALDAAREKATELEEVLDMAHSDPDFLPHPDDIDAIERSYRAVFDGVQELTRNSPEAYLLALGRQLKEAKDCFDEKGRIVETPYVKTKIARIRDLLSGGRPVFIHGELGTGKTELAKHVARQVLSRPHLARWEASHPAPQDPEERKKYEAERAEQAEALVVSGHRGIEVEQVLAARAITRKEAPPPEEQVVFIRERWREFKKTLTHDEDEKTIFKTFEKAYLDTFRAPVETRVILAPVLQAMKEGRPVIIDEMNAIPHHVLIMLNDLIMRRPGEMVTLPFPGEAPFRIEEGFALIATGNYKPEDGLYKLKDRLMYVGRSPLDAAFLSRFGIVSYDYLPATREIEPPGLTPDEQREFRRGNELFQMIVTRLLNRDLSATLPEGSFDKIKRLTMVARHLEDIFSGGEVGEAWFAQARGAAKINPQEILKENVLSIRHLIPILDRWKADGFQRELDDYLFLDYVTRSDARPEEKLYLYRILQVQGDFFSKGKGWPPPGARKEVLGYPIEEKMYKVVGGMREPITDREAKIRTYSPKEVIEELYGPAPARRELTREFVKQWKGKTAIEENAEAALERERLLSSIIGLLTNIEKDDYRRSRKRARKKKA